MTGKAKNTTKFGTLSEGVEAQLKRRAIAQLVDLGFKKGQVSRAFAGDVDSARELSLALLKKNGPKSTAVLRFSAGAMIVAFYRQRKRAPRAVLALLFHVLKIDKFGRKETRAFDERISLGQYVVAFPNASLTSAGRYLAHVHNRPKVHVTTIQNWCREIGIEELIGRIKNEDHEAQAKEVRRQCKGTGLQAYFVGTDRKPSKRGIYGFLLAESKKRS